MVNPMHGGEEEAAIGSTTEEEVALNNVTEEAPASLARTNEPAKLSTMSRKRTDTKWKFGTKVIVLTPYRCSKCDGTGKPEDDATCEFVKGGTARFTGTENAEFNPEDGTGLKILEV